MARKAIPSAVVALILGAMAVYAGPRLAALAFLPDQLDRATASARSYNPRLEEIVELERGTLERLAAVEQLEASLRGARAGVSTVDGELGSIAGRLRNDLQASLDLSVDELDRLLASLRELSARVGELDPPVSGVSRALAGAQEALERVLAQARGMAGEVNRARVAGDGAADNLAGPDGD